MEPSRRRWLGLVEHRPAWVLTWRARLLILVLVVAIPLTIALGAYPFLATSNPYPDGPVIVEGWAGDNGLEAAIAEYRRHDYPVLLFTGGPIEASSLLHSHGTFAHLGVANARKLGLEESACQPVPAPDVEVNRTFASAVALREWLEARGPLPAHVTLVTNGVHARRSRNLFQKAFPPSTRVGVVAVPDTGYNPRRWWTSSSGFRTVTGEIIAYTYVTFFFWKIEP